MRFAVNLLIVSCLFIGHALGQFVDRFDDASLTRDPDAVNGWTYYTGNGRATMDFQQRDGYASILVDATNPQMIIDITVSDKHNSSNLITISQPVLQRMIDGRTLGLALRPLGAINASFYSMEHQDGKFNARLHFNVH